MTFFDHFEYSTWLALSINMDRFIATIWEARWFSRRTLYFLMFNAHSGGASIPLRVFWLWRISLLYRTIYVCMSRCYFQLKHFPKVHSDLTMKQSLQDMQQTYISISVNNFEAHIGVLVNGIESTLRVIVRTSNTTQCSSAKLFRLSVTEIIDGVGAYSTVRNCYHKRQKWGRSTAWIRYI